MFESNFQKLTHLSIAKKKTKFFPPEVSQAFSHFAENSYVNRGFVQMNRYHIFENFMFFL